MASRIWINYATNTIPWRTIVIILSGLVVDSVIYLFQSRPRANRSYIYFRGDIFTFPSRVPFARTDLAIRASTTATTTQTAYTTITMRTEAASLRWNFSGLPCPLASGDPDLLPEVVDISQGGSLLLDTNPRLARDSLSVRSSISSGACFLCNGSSSRSVDFDVAAAWIPRLML